MPEFSYECHACGYDWSCPEPKLEEFACPACLDADGVHRDFGTPQVILRGEGWTPTFHGSSESKSDGLPTTQPSDAPSIEVSGSTAVDADGDSIWRPTDKVMRRQLRKMGAPTQAKDVDRAQDQIRRTERDANEAHAILQNQKAAKSEQTKKALEENL